MRFLPWAVALVAGTLAGTTTCAAFVVRRRLLALVGLAGTLGAVLLALAVAVVWKQSGRADSVVASLFITLGALAGGYALASALLPSVTRHRSPHPALAAVADGDAIGVVLLADAAGDEYRTGDVTRDLEAYERAEVPLPPFAARPFVYGSERARYRASDGNPARNAVREIATALSARMAGDQIAVPVEVAFCSGGPSAAEAVVRLAARSGGRIVIAHLAIARTHPFDAAAAEVHALDPTGSRLSIEYTEPLWASHAIAVRAAQGAVDAFGDTGIADGVVLVSRGNPWQFDRLFPAAMEQTTFLAQRIRAELIETGLPAERVRQAWLEWEEPDVSEAVRHLAALGSNHVALLPVDLLYRELATTVDLPMAVERAMAESVVRVAVVRPLGDDPAVIAALRHSVIEAARRMSYGEGVSAL
jgi:sirohydrochlorin ferrochelatase